MKLHEWQERGFDPAGEWQVGEITITTQMHTLRCRKCMQEVSLPHDQMPSTEGCTRDSLAPVRKPLRQYRERSV